MPETFRAMIVGESTSCHMTSYLEGNSTDPFIVHELTDGRFLVGVSEPDAFVLLEAYDYADHELESLE